MCGILGYLDFNKINLPSKDEFKKALNLMIHRGPDGFGIEKFDNLILGQRRLSIIDLSKNGKQPMSNEKETIWIVFNGEIFNFNELRIELLKNHDFKSHSDTEVLIHGYEEWGIDKLLSKINGQFAFGLYDSLKETMYIVKDRIGINPLYYYYNNNKLIFASELKSIVFFINNKTLNKNALNIYFKTGYIPAPYSIYTEINKVKPATYLKIEKNKFKENKYWKANFGNYITDEVKLIKKIRTELDNSVKLRLVSDVPVGAFLSGGVDSSAVVATMKKYKENIHTFSVGFEDKNYDETEYALNISKYFNTDHHVKIMNNKDFNKYIKKIPYYYDEPFADSSQIPTMLVSELAKKYVTVSLSGDGGDELFAGYNRYLELNALHPIHSLINKFKNTIPFLSNTIGYPMNVKISYLLDTLSYYYNLSSSQNISFDNTMLNHLQNVDLNIYLPDDIFAKVDRASLSVSLESRPPLTDYNLVNLAYQIPPNLRIKNKITKYIFKKAVEDRIPKYNIYRSKKGFSFNVKDYVNIEDKVKYNDFKDYISKQRYDYLIKHNGLSWSLYMFKIWSDYYE